MLKAARGSGIDFMAWMGKSMGLSNVLSFLTTCDIVTGNEGKETRIICQNEAYAIQEVWVTYAGEW